MTTQATPPKRRYKLTRGELAWMAFFALLALVLPHELISNIGVAGIVFTVLTLAVSSLIVTFVWLVAIPRNIAKYKHFSFAFLLISGRVFAPVVFQAFDPLLHINQTVMKSQFEHFCYYKFTPIRCVKIIKMCPTCGQQVTDAKKDVIRKSLLAFVAQSRKQAAQIQLSKRAPASEHIIGNQGIKHE